MEISEYNMIDGFDPFYTGEQIEQLPPYIVYVKPNDSGYITAVNSSTFLADTTGWTEIDSGYGDKYHHAQGNYFPQPIIDERGIYRYKLVDGKPVERTQEEMDADYVPPEVKPTDAERISQLESEKKLLTAQLQALSDRNDFVEDCIAEMAAIVYA